MTTRTFKQMGVAFGDQPLEITAKVDNVVVYQGPVTTLNEPFPELPNSNYHVTNELFSWTTDLFFTGSQVIDITVGSGAELLVATTAGNYTPIPDPNTGNIISSGPDNYITFRIQQFGNTYINGTLIDSQTINHDELPGMWWWRLASGDSFVENITIMPGA